MRVVLTWKHYLGITLGTIIILLDFIFFFNFLANFGPAKWYFAPIAVIGLFAAGIPFVTAVMDENQRQKEIEVKFLEFVRSLVENVRSGVSIPQAILQVRTAGANFGPLTPYISKLANQIEWGYPLHDALMIFGKDTGNMVIRRSVAIVIQAEKSGGDLAAVLEAVAGSVLEIKKIKDEQKSQAYGQMIQGYIIFFVFIGILIVLQVYLIPKLGEIGSEVSQGLSASIGDPTSGGAKADLGIVFTLTIVVQGLFAGLMLGKFSEGRFLAGLKHSVIMVIGGYLLLATLSGLFAPSDAPVAATSTAAVSVFFLIKRKWLQ